MAITGPGPNSPNSRSSFRLQIPQKAEGPLIFSPSETGGARLVSVQALNSDPLSLISSPSNARHIVLRQGQTARLITGRRDDQDFGIRILDQKTPTLPSLAEYAGYFKAPERPQLSLFDIPELRGLRLGHESRRGVQDFLRLPNSRSTAFPIDLSNRARSLELRLNRSGSLFPQDSKFDFRQFFQKPRTDTTTFGEMGPFSLRRRLEIGQLQQNQRQDQVDFSHLFKSPAPRSLAQATNAVSQGREESIAEARQMALGKPRAVYFFAQDAKRAFGEDLTAEQVRKAGVELLAHNPEPSTADYQILEGSVLSSKEPFKEFPKASLAVSRAVAFDHGGAREHMRQAILSKEMPIEAKRNAASLLGAGFPSFQAEDLKVLSDSALNSEDAGLRKNATHSLLAGLDWRVKEPNPAVDQNLEAIHLKDSQRADGGDKALRAHIEDTRLRLFDRSKGSEKTRLAHSLSAEQNQDSTRVRVFDHLHSGKSRDQKADEAVTLARDLSQPEARNDLMLRHASERFSAENDRLAGILSTGKTSEDKQKAIRLLANSPKQTISAQSFEKAKEFTKNHGDLETRRAVLEKMPGGPVSHGDLERAGKAAQKKIIEAIGSAEGGDLKRLAKLYQARELVKGDFKKEAHPDALERINKEIEALQKKESVQKQFQGIAQKARDEAFGGRDLGAEQSAYLTSDKFIDKLEVAGPKLSKTLLKAEMMKLQSLAPEKAQVAAEELARRLTERQGQKNWSRLDQDAQTEVVRKGLLTVQEELKGDSSNGGKALNQAISVGVQGNKVAAKIATTLQELTKDGAKLNDMGKAVKQLTKQAQQLQNALDSGDSELAKRLTEKYGDLKLIHKSVNLLQKLNDNGKLGSFGAAVGVHSLVTGGLKFNSFDAGVNTMGTLTSLAGGTDDVVKLTGWLAGKAHKGAGAAIGNAGKALGAKAAFKMLGPIGDSLSAISSGSKAWDQFSGGDTGAGVVSGLAAVGYTGAAATGLYAIAAASGPVGWVALGLGVGAWGLVTFLGESDEEALLRREIQTADGKPMRLMD